MIDWHYFEFCLLPFKGLQKYSEGVELSVCFVGKWEVDEMKETKLPGDKGLVLMSRAKHHAISAKLNKPFLFDTKPLIVQ